MKRFIIISLATILTVPALACFWVDNHNYYLFSVCEPIDYHATLDRISRDNWKAYLGLEGDDEYYFDADEIINAKMDNPAPVDAAMIRNQKEQSFMQGLRSVQQVLKDNAKVVDQRNKFF